MEVRRKKKKKCCLISWSDEREIEKEHERMLKEKHAA